MTTKTGCIVLVWGVFGCMTFSSAGQSVTNYAVQMMALVQTNPPSITLSWVADPLVTGYQVYRKLRDDRTWNTIASLSAGATSCVDSNVVVGGAYEYGITSTIGDNYGEGYVYAGILTPLTENRGKMILLVDNTRSANLKMELARLQQDLIADGWTVLRHDVPRMAVDPANTSPTVWSARSNEVAAIKALVTADYIVDSNAVTTVFILGHVPVPYSGNFNPDDHPDHKGAWPADLHYGDMHSIWPDSSVSNTSGGDARNWNMPGDGKFDASGMPWNVALQVGRVDFANLPAFPQGERELLRQYLNKDHDFRHGLVPAQRRGLIDDNFGVVHYGLIGIEAFAVNGWRNFSPFFGPTNIDIGDWLTIPSGKTYLWGYGCGPGTYTSASGVASTSELVTNDTPVVFTMLFGSYFGDWDSQNNLMRAQLAAQTHALTCAWAGRPYWYLHHMGLGETVGFSTRVSQNNYYNYGNSLEMYEVHTALMGDPTLRMHPVVPPSGLLAVTNGSGGVNLNWNASPDTLVGYYVYGAPTAAGPFTRLTTNWLTGTTYTDPLGSTNVYMVRAIKLEQTPSGSYYNPSQGIFQSLDGSAGAPQIQLYQPTNNAVFIAPPTIQLKADTFDPANCITNVSFYANGQKLGDSAGPFYNLTWSNASASQYVLVAQASCSSGLVTNSIPVSVSVVSLSPILAIAPSGGSSFNITGMGSPGLTYHVQFSDNLGPTNWQTVGTVTADAAGNLQFSASPGSSQRFYRTVYP
jgi:hypothetical protein